MYLSPKHQNDLENLNKLSSAGTAGSTLVAICNDSMIKCESASKPKPYFTKFSDILSFLKAIHILIF